MANKMDIFERRMVNINGDLRERVVYQRHMADDIFQEASGVIDERLDVIASGIFSEPFVLAGGASGVLNPHYIYSLDADIAPDASGARSIGTVSLAYASGYIDKLYLNEDPVELLQAATKQYVDSQDHNSLSGLQGGITGEYYHLTDSQHTNIDSFFLLTGRSGGQTAYGGIDSGDDLLFNSTSHATKGLIGLGSLTTGLIYDEVNNRVGIGTNTPSELLENFGNSALRGFYKAVIPDDPIPSSTLSDHTQDGTYATITTTTYHNLISGDVVEFESWTWGSYFSNSATYGNKSFTVYDTPTSTTFRIKFYYLSGPNPTVVGSLSVKKINKFGKPTTTALSPWADITYGYSSNSKVENLFTTSDTNKVPVVIQVPSAITASLLIIKDDKGVHKITMQKDGTILIPSGSKYTTPNYSNQSFLQVSHTNTILSSYNDLKFNTSTAGYSYLFNYSETDTDFNVSADGITNAFFVQGSDGYVGIGTGTPAYKLDVAGSVFARNGVNTNMSILLGSVTADDNYPGIWFGNNAVTPLYTNYAFLQSGTATVLNGETLVQIRAHNTTALNIGSEDVRFIVARASIGYQSTTLTNVSLHIKPGNSSYKGVVVRAVSGQTANLQDWQDSSNRIITTIKNDGSLVVNEAELDIDTRISANGITNALFVQGSDGNVGVGTGTPVSPLNIKNSTGSKTVRIDYTTETGAYNPANLPLSIYNDSGLCTFSIGGYGAFYEGNLYLASPTGQGTGTVINFASDMGGTQKSGLFQLDGGGNFVFRQTTSGGMYFDYINACYFRSYGRGNETEMVLSATGGLSVNPNLNDADSVFGAAGQSNALFIQGSDGNVGVGTGTPASSLDINGSLGTAIETITATDTLDSTNHTVLCNASSTAIVVNLPAASSCLGRIYIIKKIDSSANTVTIDGNASETIDGVTTKILASQYDVVTIQCDGSNWFIL